MVTTNSLDKTHTAVPIAKYQQLFDVASQATELLKLHAHEDARKSHASLVALSTRFTGEKDALASAKKTLADAKLAVKRMRALAGKLVPHARYLGELMEIPSIINFAPPDDSWVETVEELATRFEAHDKTGKGIGAAMRRQIEKRRTAEIDQKVAAERVDVASQAFSATYRHLSNEIVFGRAVLQKLGVSLSPAKVPSKSSGKKKKAVEAPATAPAVVPALVPVVPAA